MRNLVFRSFFLGALLTQFCFAEQLAVNLVTEPFVKRRLESGAVGPKKRQEVIKELFQDSGCSVDEQPIRKDVANVICTLPGQTASTIVVGGHFDFAEHGQGIVDDWSGTSLLPSLYEALKKRGRQHTYVFIAFAEEEKGLIGSSRYVKKLATEDKSRIRAFVNLECLGLASAKVWVHRSTPALVKSLTQVATAMGITLGGVNVEKVGDDDTHPFLSAKIPVISIHSLTQETFPILHSQRDRLDAIHLDEYYKTYRLVAYYLAYLDEKDN